MNLTCVCGHSVFVHIQLQGNCLDCRNRPFCREYKEIIHWSLTRRRKQSQADENHKQDKSDHYHKRKKAA